MIGVNYPAALLVTVLYSAPSGAAAPAVPAARYCKRSFGFARLAHEIETAGGKAYARYNKNERLFSGKGNVGHITHKEI